jgi:hypothetical protein
VTTSSPTAGAGSTPTPRSHAGTSPSPNAKATPTPQSGTNNRNPNWKHDSTNWQGWDSARQDPNWRAEHSRDSRWQRFEDNGRREHDDFHFDEFRSEDRDFRHDCDVLISFHSVRALLDFLDGDSSLRDFFELHGDLFDFLVHHSDWSDDFDSNCGFIDLHL